MTQDQTDLSAEDLLKVIRQIHSLAFSEPDQAEASLKAIVEITKEVLGDE